MARKLRLDCFLLYALQKNGGFFHACYTVGRGSVAEWLERRI